MIARLDKLTTQQRLLLGIGIPFVGGFLPWFLLREYDLTQDFYRWTHPELLLYPSLLLSLGSILVLSGVGACCIARTRALLVVPLAVLIGYLIGVKLFFFHPNMVFRYQLIESLSPVLVEAEIGALLGLVVARWGVPMGQRAWARVQQQIQAEAELHTAPTQIFPSSAEARVSLASSKPTPGLAGTLPEQQAAEQDDIARVLAEMKREYAEAAKQEEDKGPHQQ